MKRIHKYKLDFLNGKFHIKLPFDSEILSCQLQENEIIIWILVNPEQCHFKTFHFEKFATGQEIEFGMLVSRKFINTIQFSNGLVFHIFQRGS